MPRNMSFSMTTQAVIDRTKTVTRRLGWNDLKPGTLLWAVEKGMGLKKGEKVKKLGLIRVVSSGDERLDTLLRLPEYGRREMEREGFPDLSPQQFVAKFIQFNHLDRETYSPTTQVINRIEFEYMEDTDAALGSSRDGRGDGQTP